MRQALRITALHLKLMLRSMHAAMWLVIPLISCFLAASVYSLLRNIASMPTIMGPRDLVPAMTGALNALLLILLSSSFGAAFAHLYLARDMPLLLASPVRPRHVILSKVIEISVLGSAPFLVAGIPMLAGLGVAWYARPWFYPLAIVASVPVLVLPALAAILLNLAISRVLPAHRTRELLAATSTLLGAIVYLILRFAGASSRTALSHERLAELLGAWGLSWSPATLLSRAIAEGLLDKPLPLIAAGALLGLASVAVFRLVVPWTEKAYVSGWASYREARGGERQVVHRGGDFQKRALASVPAAGAHSRPKSPPRRLLEAAWLSFTVESRLLFRDLEAQSQVLYLLIMMLAWTVFPRQGSHPSPTAPWATMVGFLALSGPYASWSLRNSSASSRILRAAPLDPAPILAGKALFYGAVQSVSLLVILVVLAVRGRIPGLSPSLVLIAVALSYSTAAVTVCGAASNPNMAEETGIPRMAFGTGLAISAINTVLGVTGVIAAMLIERAATGPFVGKAIVMLVFLFIQAIAFRSAVQLSKAYVLRPSREEGGTA